MYIVTNCTKQYVSEQFASYDDAREQAVTMASKYVGFTFYVSRLLGSSVAEIKVVYNQRLNEV